MPTQPTQIGLYPIASPFKITHERPPVSSSLSWSEKGNPITAFQTYLTNLDLADPTEASRHYARGLAARGSARELNRATPRLDRGALNRAISDGLDPDEAADRAVQVGQDARSSAALVAERRQAFDVAARGAFRDAMKAIVSYGEENWIALLRPLVAKAIGARDGERTWDAAHDLLRFLRKYGALPILEGDFDGNAFLFGRPDLVHWWRIERATRPSVMGHMAIGEKVFLYERPTGAPQPTLADVRANPRWEPGVFTTAEAVAHLEAIDARQQALIHGAEPEARPTRRMPAIFR